jgi:SAM-dependent methyltransferase
VTQPSAGRPSPIDWRAAFEATYRAPASRVEERIWREVFGDEYPSGLDPYSYITRSELDRFVRELRLEPGQHLVDVGCGRGGAGLFVASAAGARLTGIDIAEGALVAARQRAAALSLVATFQRGEFEATGLPDGLADGVMSVDALVFTPGKAAALRELRRIVRAGGRLVFTSWDYHRQPANRPPQVPDHRPLLEAAGFEVETYDETDRWRERLDATNRGLLDAAAELAEESGEPVEEVRRDIEEMAATAAAMSRRFLAVATAR